MAAAAARQISRLWRHVTSEHLACACQPLALQTAAHVKAFPAIRTVDLRSAAHRAPVSEAALRQLLANSLPSRASI